MTTPGSALQSVFGCTLAVERSMGRADIEQLAGDGDQEVTSIRCGIIYFSQVRHDWRPPTAQG